MKKNRCLKFDCLETRRPLTGGPTQEEVRRMIEDAHQATAEVEQYYRENPLPPERSEPRPVTVDNPWYINVWEFFVPPGAFSS